MNFKSTSSAVALGVALAIGSATVVTQVRADDAAKLPPASTKTGLTYDKDIKPIFDESCVKCHGGERPKAKLSMATLAGIMKGSKEGPVVKPGKSAESQLVLSIAYVGDQDDYMPPPNNKAGIKKLTAEQVGLIRAWIDQGAK